MRAPRNRDSGPRSSHQGEPCSLLVDEGAIASVPAAPGDRQQKKHLLVWKEQKRREGLAPYASLEQPELRDCR